MALIKGIWNFKEVVTLININQKVNYINLGYPSAEQTDITVINKDSDKRILIQPIYVNVYREPSGWSDVERRVFNFGEVEQEVSDEFAMWVFENATGGRVSFPDSSNNIQVPIRDNGITVLATKGTYCETDIDVNVQIEDKTEEAFEAGKKAEYDAFWDAFQNYGNRTSYQNAFAGHGWNLNTFKPKYDIKPTQGYMLFRDNQYQGSLVDCLEQNKIVFDTKSCSIFNYMFQYSLFTRIGTIDFSSATLVTDIFNPSSIQTIDKIILPERALNFGGSFQSNELKNIEIEGNFYESVSFEKAPLSKSSIYSVVNALSSSSNTKTVTFSQKAVNNAFETTEGAADGSTSEEWLALAETKSNWTISLV